MGTGPRIWISSQLNGVVGYPPRLSLLVSTLAGDRRHFTHPDTEVFLEFPPAPLEFGSRVVQHDDLPRLDTPWGPLRIITPTLCVMDRLAAYWHWSDLSNLEQPSASFDLVWSEGALYSIGIELALRTCHRLLHPGGYLAFTDAVWCKDNPPPEVKASFEGDYPAMGRVPDVLATIEGQGFSLIDHFTLPDEAWWDDFYTPMRYRIEELGNRYANDDEALAVLDQLVQEPEMHEKYSAYYAYEFFVTRRLE